MVRTALQSEHPHLRQIVFDKKLENVYLYIDVLTCGFQGNSIETYVAVDAENRVKTILYEYYNSIQMLEAEPLSASEAKQIGAFLLEKQYKRVSGAKQLLDQIQTATGGAYKMTAGLFMKYTGSAELPETEHTVFFAKDGDFAEIAALICADDHLGKGYELHSLEAQLRGRCQNEGCENLCIRCDGRIVSHFASFAVTDDIAVVSGMVTMPQYRKRGLGSVLVRTLSAHLLQKGRLPVLYCYEEEYFSWYEKLGYTVIGTNAKLELK